MTFHLIYLCSSTLEDSKSISLPTTSEFANFPDHFPENSMNGTNKTCVMCGRVQKEADVAITRSPNKVCSACQEIVWVVVDSNQQIKYCKDCRMFCPWGAFDMGKESMSKQCSRCRDLHGQPTGKVLHWSTNDVDSRALVLNGTSSMNLPLHVHDSCNVEHHERQAGYDSLDHFRKQQASAPRLGSSTMGRSLLEPAPEKCRPLPQPLEHHGYAPVALVDSASSELVRNARPPFETNGPRTDDVHPLARVSNRTLPTNLLPHDSCKVS